MAEFTPNMFIQNLARICAEHPLAEKWLLAPNRRVGNQWVEQVARAGQAAVNLRVTTVRSLVIELAGAGSAKLLSGHGARILVSRVLHELARGGPRYFTKLTPYPALIKALSASIADLRAAGVKPERLQEGERGRGGEGETGQNLKMAELADLLAGYEAGLAAGGYVDHGGLLADVTARMRGGTLSWPGDRILLLPDGLDPGRPERALLDLLPAMTVVGLAPALPDPDQAVTDLGRMAWLDRPAEAPPPLGDGTLSILGASGEVNEVRAALRRCLAGDRPLDQVEIVYTDRDTYLPLLFETLCRYFDMETQDLDALPATFSEGIPARYSRPGRALTSWALWNIEGFPLQGLAGMVREGLLEMEGGAGSGERGAAADLLGRVPPAAGGNPADLLRALPSLDGPAARRDENGEELPGRARDRAAVSSLASLLTTLERTLPEPGSSLPGVLDAALRFLKEAARGAGEFDEYARTALLREMQGVLGHIREVGHVPGGEPLQWIVSLVREVRVAGSGPRPGRLHAAPLTEGGHSGRQHLLAVGLDDSRFPGTDRQDPVLLDGEREEISGLLSLASENLKGREKALTALALRAGASHGDRPSTLTLSCSLQDLVADRDTFPGTTLVKAFRILADPGADQEALTKYLSPPAGFIDPGSPLALDAAEWWICRFTSPQRVTGALHAFARRFGHLERGMVAARERGGHTPTPWEGLVGPLPPGLDILAPEGPAVSANRLQALGACPLRYFFRYVLDLERVDEEPPEPDRWLSPADRGSLLHDLFHVYMDRLIKEGQTPDAGRDSREIEGLLDQMLRDHERTVPPPSPHVREHERAQMAEAARIFLREEEEFALHHEPLFAEASIGLPSTDLPTELDHPDPVLVSIGPDRTLKVRGRIDRIDQRRADGCFVVTDYKSGSNWLYTRKDRFHEGRVVQHLLYLRMAEARLRETIALAPPVAAFRFLFPTARAQGESVLLTREELEGRAQVLSDLCDLAEAGCFVPTDSADDCAWCDYAIICGDTASQAMRVAAKLEKGEDERLDPLRRLRGYI